MHRRQLILGAPALLALPRARAQQAFPARSIRYIVPVAAGGGSDFVGRTVTERWAKVLGQSFVVDNIGGGGGAIACQTTAKAPADGYTLLQGYVATHGTSPATRSKLPYDPIKEFTPIGCIGGTPNLLVVNAQLPVSSVKELVAYLKANPTRVSYGSAGQGSLTHLSMELFKQSAGVFMVHLPYRGVAPAFSDLLGNQTQSMFPSLVSALPHIRSGRLRALAVTGAQRHPVLKDVPTMIESGFKGFDAVQWYGVVGPAGMPVPVVKTLNETLNSALAGDLRDKLANEAVEPMPMTPEAFGNYIKADIARWSGIARERKIDLDA